MAFQHTPTEEPRPELTQWLVVFIGKPKEPADAEVKNRHKFVYADTAEEAENEVKEQFDVQKIVKTSDTKYKGNSVMEKDMNDLALVLLRKEAEK